MRIQACYNFYLDFMLPRIDNTDPIGVQTQIDHCDARIFTRGEGEPLFPTDVDRTLSSAMVRLTPIARPEISISWEAGSRILDRISVILEWDQSTSPVEEDLITEKYLERALVAANAILDHIRVSSDLFEIKKISRSWDPIKSKIEITAPYTQSCFDADSGDGINVFDDLNSAGACQGIRVGPVPVTSMATLSRTMTGEGPPPLHLSLLLDAKEALSTVSLREAILFMASACEVRARLFAETQSVASKTRVNNIFSDKSASFATKYFDRLPYEVCARSLRADSPSVFRLIDEAYSERNKLIHTGQLSRQFNDNDQHAKLQQATEWHTSATAAINWMDSLGA
jgi:hypothetical protein